MTNIYLEKVAEMLEKEAGNPAKIVSRIHSGSFGSKSKVFTGKNPVKDVNELTWELSAGKRGRGVTKKKKKMADKIHSEQYDKVLRKNPLIGVKF